jgi:hypothetical protein
MASSRGVVPALLAAVVFLVALGVSDPAHAQPKAVAAEVKTVNGKVEVQRRGETQWLPAVAGAKLVEGDNIRAHAGSSATLDLPDGSTILVAENSRVVVSKLEIDPQTQTREAFFHLVVGKLQAIVSQAAISLVKARQSNFSISTPTAVAAARGTVFEVVFDATQNTMRVAVLAKDPQKATGLVLCYSLYDRFSRVLVREGLASSVLGTGGCGAPVPIASLPDASLIGTLQNPRIPGPAFSAPVTVPNISNQDTATPVVFTSDPGTLSPAPPSTIGQDIGQVPSQEPSSTPAGP